MVSILLPREVEEARGNSEKQKKRGKDLERQNSNKSPEAANICYTRRYDFEDILRSAGNFFKMGVY